MLWFWQGIHLRSEKLLVWGRGRGGGRERSKTVLSLTILLVV
jgi:hypothetical protein